MPSIKRTPKIHRRASSLRHNQTDAETYLWSRLRAHRMDDIHFRRQHPIGNYVVDFCAPCKKLIIELDGGQHLERADYDAERSAYLKSKGYRVIRFWNHEVMNNIESVLKAIDFALSDMNDG